jgi:transcriptional regulator with XRE-family HTH domain
METPTPRANIVFGQRLRAVRKDRGWTLRFLAAKAGVHWTYLGQVERGERNVSLLTILRLAKALGIDAGVLLKGLRADVDAGRGADESGDADDVQRDREADDPPDS